MGLINHLELPLVNLIGHGDVAIHSIEEVKEFCKKAGLSVESIGQRKGFRLHLVARKGEAHMQKAEEGKKSGLMKRVFNNTRKPEGRIGGLMAKGMNGGSHAKLAKWGFEHINVPEKVKAIDIGCGGGGNVKRLLEMAPKGKVVGVDYSEVSVATAKKTNREQIREGRCRILQGDAAALPLGDGIVDLVTAFETVYFWPEIEKSFAEVYRVLKLGGRFMITNESDGKNEASLKWTKIVDGMRVYTGAELEKLLKDVGFSEVIVDDDEKNDRICVVAVK